ncbi:MAG: helicase-related protein, partial [Myxococcales bacterium]
MPTRSTQEPSFDKFRLAKAGVSADRLDGDLEQFHRDQVLARFRNQSLRLLFATDVAGPHVISRAESSLELPIRSLDVLRLLECQVLQLLAQM